MTDDDVKDLFGRLVADPPASAVDTDAAIRDGRRQHARKQQLWIGTAAAGALAAAATFSAITGGAETPSADAPGVTGTVLPDEVVVTCTPDGIEVSATEIRTRPDGVAFVGSSTTASAAYLRISDPYMDGISVGGRELTTTPTRWSFQSKPGELILQCASEQMGSPYGAAVRLLVSDPDHNWHDRGEINKLGCRGGEAADWISELYQSGATPVSAAQAVADAFRSLEGNRDAVFTVKEFPVHYADGVNQTWVAYRNGEPYVTVLVNRDGDGFKAGPNDRCSGFDLSAG